MTAAIFGLAGVIIGGIINILTNYFLVKSEIKEKKRIEKKIEFDNHSRIFRKIGYEIDKYLDDYLKTSLGDSSYKIMVKKKTDELLEVVESIDVSLIDGVGINYYYGYLDTIRYILKICSYSEATGDHVRKELVALEVMNNSIKQTQLDKKIK